jgi:hypothetical protein
MSCARQKYNFFFLTIKYKLSEEFEPNSQEWLSSSSQAIGPCSNYKPQTMIHPSFIM